MQLGVRIPDHLVSMLDEHVDGTRYRSRAQLITMIVAGWLAEKETADPYADAYERDDYERTFENQQVLNELLRGPLKKRRRK